MMEIKIAQKRTEFFFKKNMRSLKKNIFFEIGRAGELDVKKCQR